MLPIFTAQNAQPLAPAASTRLLRNFGELAPAGTPYAGLPIASGTWWGLTGSEIAASAGVGEHGPGLLANDSLAPDAEYRLVVRNSTFAPDALVVQEDGAVEYLGPGTAVYDLYEANLLLPGGPAAVSGAYQAAQASLAAPLESITGQVTVGLTAQAVIAGELSTIAGTIVVGTFAFGPARGSVFVRAPLRTIGGQEIP